MPRHVHTHTHTHTHTHLVRGDELFPRRLEARLVDGLANGLARLCQHHQVRRAR